MLRAPPHRAMPPFVPVYVFNRLIPIQARPCLQSSSSPSCLQYQYRLTFFPTLLSFTSTKSPSLFERLGHRQVLRACYCFVLQLCHFLMDGSRVLTLQFHLQLNFIVEYVGRVLQQYIWVSASTRLSWYLITNSVLTLI